MTSTRSHSTDADNPALKLIRERVKKEYRRVFDKDYDAQTKRDEDAARKTHSRSKVRKRKSSKRAKARKANRKVLLIKDLP